MACNCIAGMDASLLKYNTRIARGLFRVRDVDNGELIIDKTRLTVGIVCERINPYDPDIITVVASFCPFCGVHYTPEFEPAEAV